MKINKVKIVKYFFCFLMSFGMFNFRTYSILNSDNNIVIYKNIVVFTEYGNTSFSPLALFDAKLLGDEKKYFYGVLKLNINRIDELCKDKGKYLTYDDEPLKYVFEGNEISYFVFDKTAKKIKVYDNYKEFREFFEKENIKIRLYPTPIFKTFKTFRKLRTNVLNIFSEYLNPIDDFHGYDVYFSYPLIHGGF